jgi:hypothetical protein
MRWASEIIGSAILLVIMLGFVDVVGPEYTWWNLIVHIHNGSN